MVTKAKKRALAKKPKKTKSKLAMPVPVPQNDSSDFVTGRSKHYGFIEFENPEVAKVVADEIHGYLLFEHQLQIKPIPPERVHPKLWRGMNLRFKQRNWTEIERWRHNRERTVEQHQHLVEHILRRDGRCRKRVAAAGIDYEFPEFVGSKRQAPKKIRFDLD